MKLGYTIIYVPNIVEAVRFYEDAFSMERQFVHPGGDYAEMATGGTLLGFCSHELAKSVVPCGFAPIDPDTPPAGFEISLTTEDVAAAFNHAVSSGAKPIAEPEEKPWGQTASYVRDPFGVLVGIVSPIDPASQQG